MKNWHLQFACFLAGAIFAALYHPKAAVTPTVPYIQSGPGLNTVNDANWAVTAFAVDSVANTVTVTFRSGTASIASSHTTAFAADASGLSANVVYTLGTTNTAQVVSGITSGKSWALSAAEITAVQAIISGGMQAVQNPAESDAVSNNVFGTGATNVPWASGDF
jgi:hypothetical protein